MEYTYVVKSKFQLKLELFIHYDVPGCIYLY